MAESNRIKKVVLAGKDKGREKGKTEWETAKTVMGEVGGRAQHYGKAFIMKKHNRRCRIVTKKQKPAVSRKRPKKLPRNYNSANGNYQRTAEEPWILATNLPSKYNTTQIINYYKKRMQIEESFRDIKSHQFGLGGRYARTTCIHRWAVKMLLAAIAQIILWILGVIGHSKGLQKAFQANTVKDKKVFSYFYLGKLIVEHDMIDKLKINQREILETVEQELAREW